MVYLELYAHIVNLLLMKEKDDVPAVIENSAKGQ